MNRVLTQNEKDLRDAIFRGNNARILELLTATDVDVNAKNNYNSTALFCAVDMRNVEATQWLLKHNADPNLCNFYRWTPLHLACEHNSKAMVSLLLEHKADANCVDAHFFAPIHSAAACASPEVLALLIPHVSNLDYQNNVRETALDFAAERYRFDNIDVLLEAGATVHGSLEVKQMMTRRRFIKSVIVVFVGILRHRFGLYRDISHVLARAIWAKRRDERWMIFDFFKK